MDKHDELAADQLQREVDQLQRENAQLRVKVRGLRALVVFLLDELGSLLPSKDY